MKKILLRLSAGILFNLFSLFNVSFGNSPISNLNSDELKYRLVVNLVTKKLYFFDDESIYSFQVGIGKEGRETPPMDFVVLNKLKYPSWVPNLRSVDEETRKYLEIHNYLPNSHKLNPLHKYWIGIGGSYGIHDVKGDKGIGEKSSLGCVRIRTSDLERIFHKIDEGMKGIIIDDDEKLTSFFEEYISFRKFFKN